MKKQLFLLFGDSAVYWLALCLTLILRWGTHLAVPFVLAHVVPFGALFAAFVTVLYSMQLYQRAVYGSRRYDSAVATVVALALFLGIAIVFFYFYSRLESAAIAPRGSLLLFWVILSGLMTVWRTGAESVIRRNLTERVLIVGDAPGLKELGSFLTRHEEYGFRVFAVSKPPETPEALAALARQESIETMVSSDEFFPDSLYAALPPLAGLNLNFFDLSSFYEYKLKKIYLGSVSNIWVLSNVVRHTPLAFSVPKAVAEKIIAAAAFLVLLPLGACIAFGIALTSPGPVFYAQKRVGKNNREFMLYKFRTMRQNAEAGGAQWAQRNDPRITVFGKLLRASHLDELPQILNILKGELSFVGPRPERPEFVPELSLTIPFYSLRHALTPGITGWAQINYPYGASLADAKEKLQYDLYYLKHRSVALDTSIVLKTIRRFFQNPAQAA